MRSKKRDTVNLMLCIAECFAVASCRVPVPFLGGMELILAADKHCRLNPKYFEQVERLVSEIIKKSETVVSKVL